MTVLWGDLGIGVLVLVTGALLVPALGFAEAMVAVVIGSVIGVALLSLGAAAGAAHGVPTMVLFRPVLGIRGSWFPSVLNAMQMIGWTAVELWAMSFVADLVSQRAFGFSARGLWLAVAAVTCTALALWGPVGVVRVWMERFGVWIISAICITVTVLAFTSGNISAALSAPGTGGLPFGSALDLVIAMPISWLPLVADYTRFARGPRAAFSGTFVGYLVANIWLYALGMLLVLSSGASPSPEGIALGVLALAPGTVAGFLFLIGLLAGETDEAFANIYSGSVTLQNIAPRIPQPVLIVAIAAIGTALAGLLTMELYETFLFLLGSVFVPLFGVLAADHFINRRGRIDADDLFDPAGAYWYSGGIRMGAFVPWIAGFALYHWIAPTGPDWWVTFVSGLSGGSPGGAVAAVGASLPALALSFLGALALPRLSSRRQRVKEAPS